MLLEEMARELADLYPAGRIRVPFLRAPKWAVWLLAPLTSLSRDYVVSPPPVPLCCTGMPCWSSVGY